MTVNNSKANGTSRKPVKLIGAVVLVVVIVFIVIALIGLLLGRFRAAGMVEMTGILGG